MLAAASAAALHLHAPAAPNRGCSIAGGAFAREHGLARQQQHQHRAISGINIHNLQLRGGSSREWDGNVRGVLAIIFAIFAQVELFGRLSKSAVLPSVATRKLTHIFTGAQALHLFLPFFASPDTYLRAFNLPQPPSLTLQHIFARSHLQTHLRALRLLGRMLLQ